jgi:hypothetical protein
LDKKGGYPTDLEQLVVTSAVTTRQKTESTR